VLVTVHRAQATATREALAAIVEPLNELAATFPVVFPVHPRTKGALATHGLRLDARIRCLEPVSHRAFLKLMLNARALVTDSGGAQKEACILEVPCFTLREETEWNETVDSGWNVLLGARPRAIAGRIEAFARPRSAAAGAFGDGKAAERIAALLQIAFASSRGQVENAFAS
jgi:UDP-N-acetylglucosamine 2-epimerase